MTTLTKATQGKSKRPNLERQALLFTISLYLCICAALLAVHYLAPEPPPGPNTGTSSTSPFNP
ncbi:hypothetical protein V1227_05935 [Lentzea sp. DG1S-22]|uniref:hypothetical protein n=1 Tax=Lentzea sp. DG1S-22 TaxID=3108822 RepID=UPI002E774E85|nr:hypothetical protein [Lentzea sp. DG1S-22]WVH82298.1 hypothetical protein V1227_05935 [Lentzea sp. DG1S-22]